MILKNITAKDFEFYTFFTGLKQKELDSLIKLFDSFPYFYTNKIMVIDNSRATREIIESGNHFYYSERAYLRNVDYDIDYDSIDEVFDRYGHHLRRIITDTKLFHSDGINIVLHDFAKTDFTVIMDSDIVFRNDQYLNDMIGFVERYEDLLAVGQIYQSMPFHLTLGDFKSYNFFLRKAFGYLYKRVRLGRFPQIIPVLLCVNRNSFNEYNMSFKNLYLDVFNDRDKQDHKLFGDVGSSFLFQCALAGKMIVNIDIGGYVDHVGHVAIAESGGNGWSWFKR